MSSRTKVWFSENGALVALVVLAVALSLLSSDFLSVSNLLNVGVQAAVTAILAFGATFVIITAGIDLSVGSVAALSAITLAYLSTTSGLPWPLATVIALAVGVVCGLANAALIAYGKLPPSSRPWPCSASPGASRWSSPRAARSPCPTRSPTSATPSAATCPSR
ncbi:ABC transporter permease [Nonomuraea recticatena]|uniref:ABC transporter permease n=1 Tax=Nonomuraea recticatena TaxID=46178 RepID=UPI003605BAA7